jgi:cytidylate kinase
MTLDLVITVSGFHGTGKTTVAEMLARALGLRHVSAGQLFRQMAEERGLSLSALSVRASEKDELDRLVDSRTKEEAKKGNAVIDGLLAGWMAGEDADLKFYLFAPDDVRVARIARRDKCSLEEARKATFSRERLERRRFKRFYAIDIDDLSIYDLILNTGLLSPRGNVRVLEGFARAYMREREAG